MKNIKLLLLVPLLLVFVFLSVTPFSGCKKTDTIHDTLTRHDTTTITKHDTTIVKDTLYDITSGLVAWYNFNNGTLKDSSGYNNHIVFNNATSTTDRFGHANNAYLFDGSTSYMRVSNSSTINPNFVTIFAIVKLNGFYHGTCHGNQILGKGYPEAINGFYSLRYSDFVNCSGAADTLHEYVAGVFGDNSPSGTASGASTDTVYAQKGVWYTLAYTYDGITSKVYINGVLKASVQKTAPFTANTNDLYIGRHEDPSYPYWFNGVIDEIRIYNRALSASAIKQLITKVN